MARNRLRGFPDVTGKGLMMEDHRTIEISTARGVATIWLNRPSLHNAFNYAMIESITGVIDDLEKDSSVRIIVIRGRGRSFCAGADIKWLMEDRNSDAEKNHREALKLSECFHKIYTCRKPVIAAVHGASTGGANGLVAASDIVICTDDALFSLSEVRIGLVPAVISPYVIKRIGEFPARELMLTARRISGKEAAERGLANYSCSPAELESRLEEITGQLLEGGPEALSICKQLISDVVNHFTLNESVARTADILAEIRVSKESREGMAAFLEKRKPRWRDHDSSPSGETF